MINQRVFAILILIPFAPLSFYALVQEGYVGLFAYQLGSPAGWQVLADLVIALLLVLSWLIADAKRAGRNPWPWVLITLATGSFGPLLYLLSSKQRTSRVADPA